MEFLEMITLGGVAKFCLGAIILTLTIKFLYELIFD